MVRKAVIPAAGLGTRLLPATKAQPKEMLPLIDKPAIQYVVEEAAAAGIEDVLIVIGRGRQAMEDHFDRLTDLERHLAETGKGELADEIRRIAELADIHYVRQQEPLGFGHAVLCARAHVGDEPFVVMVPDEIVPPKGPTGGLLTSLVEAHEATGADIIAVQKVAVEAISAYGVVTPAEPILDLETSPELIRIASMIEKPPAGEAPSDLAARGRYVFSADLFEALDKTARDSAGEIQLTNAIDRRAHEADVRAFIYDGVILDTGKKLDYVKTTIELALGRDDLAEPLTVWLKERLQAL